MESERAECANTDEYIQRFPPEVQKTLEELRATIRAAAPDAVEKISYQIRSGGLYPRERHHAVPAGQAFDLVGRIVSFRVEENTHKAADAKKSKSR